MKIKSIKLINFRQFKDVFFEFSVDRKKNVSVVLAENSTGKTTLMQSIKWCLYGEMDLDNKNDLLNQEVRNKSRNEFEDINVEVVIDENGKEYLVSRTRKVKVKSNRIEQELIKIEFKSDSGENQIIVAEESRRSDEKDKINRIINTILSEEMSDYFLFDGERIDSLGANNAASKKDISNAISAVNEYEIYERSLDSLKKIRRFYKSEISEESNDNKIKELQKEINVYEDKIKELESSIQNNTFQINESERELVELDNRLKTYDKIKEFSIERTRLEKDLKVKRDDLKEREKRIIDSQRKYQESALIFALREKYKNLKFNEELENETVPDMKASSIDHIIERGVCICGEKLTEEHLEHLLWQKDYQPPISNADLVRSFNVLVDKKTNTLDRELDFLNNYYLDFEKIEADIFNADQRVRDLDIKIGNDNSKDIQLQNERRGQLKENLKVLHKNQNIENYQSEEYNKSLLNTNKEFSKLLRENEDYKYNSIKLELIDESIDVLQNRLDKLKVQGKKDIQEMANKHFSDIIYKDKYIDIDDNFEYTVKERDKTIAAPSEGERIAISMSLILAIIDIHKKNTDKNEGFIESEKKEFSIILDAAFATLDNQFSKRISEKLPMSLEQVILFSTMKQFSGSVEEALKPYTAKKYSLKISDNGNTNVLTQENLEVVL